jgi:DNA polymerase III epsilon subunit-like protein
MRLLGFDLETTGLDTSTARIWQVATNEKAWLVYPGAEIPQVVRELCHIDDALLERIHAAPAWEDLQAEVLAHLCSADALVTHNGTHYDLPCLRAHIGDSIPLPPIIDTKVLAFEAWPDIPDHKIGETVYSGHRLVNLALHLGLASVEDIEAGAHDARFDCWLALKVFRRLPKKWTEDLERLLAFQQRALELQSRDWERFGVVPQDGPRFLWFRTCRLCRQFFTGRQMRDCPTCGGWGVIHATKKRRGQAIDAGFLSWLRRQPSCPAALRA